MGRLPRRGRVNGDWPHLHGVQVEHNRTVLADGRALQRFGGRVPNRRLLRPQILHRLLLLRRRFDGQGARGGDQAQGGPHHRRHARPRRVLALPQARLRWRLRHGAGPGPRPDDRRPPRRRRRRRRGGWC
ncbi:unnamed protein product [Linum tenue]|uniref:Uncharacterized protein n=1 Tax=Linum tenue TaxID=586396 RepID=A0AAV0HY11_9ROSI|nr:unnamed protein product [Linum tenue]